MVGKNGAKWVGLIVALWMLSVEPPISSQQPGSDELKQEREVMWNVRYNHLVVGDGIINYLLDNLKLPSSLNDICNGPYTGIRCSDLINPYTGKPIKQDEFPGNVLFHQNGDKFIFQAFRLENGNLFSWQYTYNIPEKIKLYEEQAKLPWSEVNEVKKLDSAGKRAHAVGRLVWMAIQSYVNGEYDRFGRKKSKLPPATFDEYLQIMRSQRAEWIENETVDGEASRLGSYNQWLDLSHLANDYTGGYAQYMSTFSPGNFRYYRETEGPFKDNMFVEVYGKDGNPVFKRRILIF